MVLLVLLLSLPGTVATLNAFPSTNGQVTTLVDRLASRYADLHW